MSHQGTYEGFRRCRLLGDTQASVDSGEEKEGVVLLRVMEETDAIFEAYVASQSTATAVRHGCHNKAGGTHRRAAGRAAGHVASRHVPMPMMLPPPPGPSVAGLQVGRYAGRRLARDALDDSISWPRRRLPWRYECMYADLPPLGTDREDSDSPPPAATPQPMPTERPASACPASAQHADASPRPSHGDPAGDLSHHPPKSLAAAPVDMRAQGDLFELEEGTSTAEAPPAALLDNPFLHFAPRANSYIDGGHRTGGAGEHYAGVHVHTQGCTHANAGAGDHYADTDAVWLDPFAAPTALQPSPREAASHAASLASVLATLASIEALAADPTTLSATRRARMHALEQERRFGMVLPELCDGIDALHRRLRSTHSAAQDPAHGASQNPAAPELPLRAFSRPLSPRVAPEVQMASPRHSEHVVGETWSARPMSPRAPGTGHTSRAATARAGARRTKFASTLPAPAARAASATSSRGGAHGPSVLLQVQQQSSVMHAATPFSAR